MTTIESLIFPNFPLLLLLSETTILIRIVCCNRPLNGCLPACSNDPMILFAAVAAVAAEELEAARSTYLRAARTTAPLLHNSSSSGKDFQASLFASFRLGAPWQAPLSCNDGGGGDDDEAKAG